MFGLVNEFIISFGLYLFVSLPFTETEYIGIKCLIIVILLFHFLIVRVGSGFIPSWFLLLRNLMDPLVARVSIAAKRVREALLL